MWISRCSLLRSLVHNTLRAASHRDVISGSYRVTFRAPSMECVPPCILPQPGNRASELGGDPEDAATRVKAASENEAAERNRQKRKRRIKQKRTSSHKTKPESVESLLTELPFAHADICSLFETTKAVDKKVKKKIKRHKLEPDEDGDKSKKKTRPNYFVSLPILNVKILDDIQTIQNSVLQKDDRLSSAMIPQGSFHLTLFVMHLASEDEVALATTALLDSKKPIEEILQGNILVLSFCGISDFRHQVAFVNLTNDVSIAALKQISETTGKIFMEKGISVTGSKDFMPHLTFMKLSRAPKLRNQGIKKIEASLYEDFQAHCFGEDTLMRLDLCSMIKKKQPSGYYHTEASIFFGHKNGREPDDAELVSLSKRLVENAVLKAVQQYIEETQAKTKQTDGISLEPGNNEKTENNLKH
ncbi:A-kinase anchoring protein 7 isoform 2-T2 [Anomaloglossus baeobatrachus]|uniref:A-kinase anchoring protein 7 isoform X2 n=1 Tax=Anomaloglossus baeobatrachus TaxID=238106 RepID=UPI003F501E22